MKGGTLKVGNVVEEGEEEREAQLILGRRKMMG